jgi:hypothetical protein
LFVVVVVVAVVVFIDCINVDVVVSIRFSSLQISAGVVAVVAFVVDDVAAIVDTAVSVECESWLFVVSIGVVNFILPPPKIDHDIDDDDDDDDDDCSVNEVIVVAGGDGLMVGLSLSSSSNSIPRAFCISIKFTTHNAGPPSDDDDDIDIGRANAHDRCAYTPHATHWSIPLVELAVAVHSRRLQLAPPPPPPPPKRW